MSYNAFLGRDDADPNQLELFRDPAREQMCGLIQWLVENEDEVKRMHDMMEKVLAGEPRKVKKDQLPS